MSTEPLSREEVLNAMSIHERLEKRVQTVTESISRIRALRLSDCCVRFCLHPSQGGYLEVAVRDFDGDSDEVCFPLFYLWDPDFEAREQEAVAEARRQAEQMRREREEKERRERAAKEEQLERALYERLKKKYGDSK